MKKSDDKVVAFYEKSHTYKNLKTKEYYPSVTTKIKELFPEFDAKTISKYVAKSRCNKGDKTTPTKVQREWKEKGRRACDKGNLIHYEMELYALGEAVDLFTVFRPESRLGIAYLEDKAYGKELIPEKLVYSDEYKIAGQVDLIVQDDDGVTIIDYKTNEKIETKSKYGKGTHWLTSDLPDCNHSKYSVQLNIYAKLLELEGFIIKDLIIAHLTIEGVVEYPVDYKSAWAEQLLEELT